MNYLQPGWWVFLVGLPMFYLLGFQIGPPGKKGLEKGWTIHGFTKELGLTGSSRAAVAQATVSLGLWLAWLCGQPRNLPDPFLLLWLGGPTLGFPMHPPQEPPFQNTKPPVQTTISAKSKPFQNTNGGPENLPNLGGHCT